MHPIVWATAPLDWVGSVVVPVTAILVSTGVAVALASLERRAARRDRQAESLADVLVALTEINGIATDRVRRAEIPRRLTRLVATVNVAAAHFQRRDVVFELVVTMVLREEKTDRRRLGLAAARAMALLDDWRRGRISDAQIEKMLETYPMKERGYRA